VASHAAGSELSIVVVTWRSAARLEALVDSIHRHLGEAAELVVVENASGEDPERVARAYRGPVRYIALERNHGFGAACNIGVEASGAPHTALLNPDCELADSALPELAALAARRGGLAGPRLLNPDGSIQPSASGPPTGIWPWVGAVIPGRLQPAPLLQRTEPWRLERTARVAWLTGACVAGARDVLLTLGPFDPAIHMYSEDMDLGLRAADRGIESYFCPDVCRVVHNGGASTSIAFPHGAHRLAARNRRVVVRRAYGARRERWGWLAQRVNLRLRVTAKGLAGRDASSDRIALQATRAATPVAGGLE
jgi:GT2 family glycosyltransferase